jgi:hypothetical protein
MPGIEVSCLAASGTNLFAGTIVRGAFLTTDNGISWTSKNSGMTTAWITELLASGTNLFAGTEWAGVFSSENNGTNWNVASSGLPSQVSGATTIWALAAMGGNLFAGMPYYGLFRSTNDGSSWTAANADWTINKTISSFAVAGTDLFAGTMGGVARSTDNGTSWSFAGNGPSTPGSLVALGTNLFAGKNGVYRSIDSGKTWILLSSGLTNTSVNALATSGSQVFAGTEDGVFYLNGNDTIWAAANAGLTSRSIHALAIVGTNLYAGTRYGVWRCSLPLLAALKPSENELPSSFELAQNYPNPFNPCTTIRYGIPNRAQVTLTVFNTLGQQVAQLVNGEVEAGYHDVGFDGSGLASGVYLYRIQAGSYGETKKVLLVR